MFDNYVSLGHNCEGAFQFRRLLGRDVAYYFNWLVTPLDALVEILRADFAGAYDSANLKATQDVGMILDQAYGMKYHSAFRKELGGRLEGPRYLEIHADSATKYSMLADRFRDLARSPNRVLYVVKTAHEAPRGKAIELRDILTARYPGHDFRIAVLQTADREEADWGEDRIHNRYLSRFADASRANDGHVPSWDRVFAEFPLRPGAMARPV